jgi:hypothetical protein
MKAFEVAYLDGRVLTISAVCVRETAKSLVFQTPEGREWPFSKRNMCCWSEVGEMPAATTFDAHCVLGPADEEQKVSFRCEKHRATLGKK